MLDQAASCQPQNSELGHVPSICVPFHELATNDVTAVQVDDVRRGLSLPATTAAATAILP